MAIQILMPALSPTMTEGTLARWLVSEGDSVRSGDVIAEIETDKATMEVEAIDDGILGKILVSAGSENVAVNSVIGLLAEEGEDASALELPAGSSPAPSATAVASEPVATTAAAQATSESAPIAAAGQPAAMSKPSQSTVPAEAIKSDSQRVFASPLARRIASQNNVDIQSLSGTGPHGRIIKADVEAALASPKPGFTSPSTAIATGGSEFVPHTAMRRTIAARLQESKQQAPHFYLTVDCELDTLLENRKALNSQAGDDVKISVNDLIIRAAAMAQKAVPQVNGYFEEEGCRYFEDVDISMAVAIEGGLITPVVRNADKLGLAELSKTTKDLALRAREGKLAPEEYAGGGFTISNLGMFGVREFAAVINPPQSAILAVGAGEQRAVVKDGALAVATIMSVTLSADHRIVDGALGAQWLQAFKGFVENPVTMLL